MPAISQLVGASVAVKPSSASDSTVTCTGPEPVTFGFVVQQISYVDGRWTLRDAPASADIAFRDPGAQAGPKGVILTGEEDCRLDLFDPA